MNKLFSLVLAGAASIALLSVPALAQAPMSQTPPAAASGTAPASGMAGMKMAPKKTASKAPRKKMAMAGATKRSCMDYAWQSQDQKDCEAGKLKPPNWR